MTATVARPLPDAAPAALPRPARVGGLDAVRGLAIGLMVFVNLRGSDDLPGWLEHSAWHGMTVADTVFPMFLFALGASLVLSHRTGSVRGAAVRSLKLVALGALLAALWHWEVPRPAFGVLAHIAAASFLACLLLRLPVRRQIVVVAGLLAGLAVAGALTGWDPSGAWGVRLDDRFFGGFTPEGPQSWIGSIASIWFGVVAGRIALAHQGIARRLRVLGLGCLLLLAGVTAALVVPINKALWTPSFALAGAGIAALVFVVFDLLDGAIPALRPLGANPIVAYVFAESALWAVREHVWYPIRGTIEPVLGVGATALLYPAVALGACIALCGLLRRHGVRVSV